MIKTILSTLILATISLTASAEYIIKMPLEVAQGGTLPNGSIKIVSSTPVAPPVDYSASCNASAVNKNTMHVFFGIGNVTSHSYASNTCTINLNVNNYSLNPEGTPCIENGDGTATFTETNPDGQIGYVEVMNKTYSGTCR